MRRSYGRGRASKRGKGRRSYSKGRRKGTKRIAKFSVGRGGHRM